MRIERLSTFMPQDKKQIEAIYVANFPVEERKPFKILVNGGYLCLVHRRELNANDIVAFAFLLPLTDVGLMFMEYLAVDKALQGRGLGSSVLSEVITYLQKASWGGALVWEVEPPENNPESDASRRIRFYKRLGAKLIEHSKGYAMPDYNNPGAAVPLRLMQLPLEEQPGSGEVAKIVKNIYTVAYPDYINLMDGIRVGDE